MVQKTSHNTLFILLLLLVMGGCGYKPSAKYSRNIVGEKINTSVIISSQDPENTVIIKDAVDSAIIEIFHASLCDKEHANTQLTFSISEPSYTPIQYDPDGFVIAYRATTSMKITRKTKHTLKNYHTQGTYDFSVVPNAVLTDQERFEAIQYSAAKAISSFLAKIAAEGSQKSGE